MYSYDETLACAEGLKQILQDVPDTAIILGSGLGSFVDAIDIESTTPYCEITNFPQTTVSGHAGSLLKGTLAGKPILCLQGRVHSYEDQQPRFMTVALRALKMIGVKNLIITSAVGSLKESMPAGSLMMVTDHINFSGISPLAGPNDERFGPRFPDLTEAYPEQHQERLRRAASEADIQLHEGVFLMVRGPVFETPAEIKMFQTFGADVVGMSMVPEVLIGHHCGLKIAAVAMITNLGAGMTENKLTHDETLSEGAKAASSMAQLLQAFVAQLN